MISLFPTWKAIPVATVDTETSSSSFLGDLGPPIRRYPYRGPKQFLETVKMEQSRQEEFEASEWVLFSNVNKQVFSRDFLNSDSILQRCWNSSLLNTFCLSK